MLPKGINPFRVHSARLSIKALVSVWDKKTQGHELSTSDKLPRAAHSLRLPPSQAPPVWVLWGQHGAARATAAGSALLPPPRASAGLWVCPATQPLRAAPSPHLGSCFS